MLIIFAILAHLLVFARAAPTNACDYVGATPLLYHQYDSKSCPPPRHLQKNGIDCEWRIPPDDYYQCDSFCQVRTNFFYAMETPIYGNPYCYGPVTCGVGAGDHVVYNGGAQLGESVNVKTLNDGVGIFHSFSGSLKLTTTCRSLEDGMDCAKGILHPSQSL